MTAGSRGTSPGSDLHVRLGATRIVVRTAKRPGGRWDPAARRDIETARRTYRLWGDFPTWDRFDALESTSQYIAYVEYATCDGPELEALTMRLVREQPEDVTFYEAGGRPLAAVLEERCGLSVGGPGPLVAGASRIGAIRPTNARRNAYTLEAFAALHVRLTVDGQAEGIACLASQVGVEFPARVLRKGQVRYECPPAEAFLGVGPVRLDRSNPTVAAHLLAYPGYFLDKRELTEVIADAITTRALSLDRFRAVTGLAAIEDIAVPANGRALVPLLQADDAVGAAFRRRVLAEVGDGVFCSLTTMTDHAVRAARVLHRLGATIGGRQPADAPAPRRGT